MKTAVKTLALAGALAFAPASFAADWSDYKCGADWGPTKSQAPSYPRRARERGIEGYIVMSFSVTPEGTVEDIKVAEAENESAFVRSATRAVESLEFPPCMVNGLATRVNEVSIKYDFNLGG